MAELFAWLAGLLLAAGVYLILQRELTRVLFGIVLVGNALNVAILSAGRLEARTPAFVPDGAVTPSGLVANPLPQALVLTALVISFGLVAFSLALTARVYEHWGRTDTGVLDELAVLEGERAMRPGEAPPPGGAA